MLWNEEQRRRTIRSESVIVIRLKPGAHVLGYPSALTVPRVTERRSDPDTSGMFSDGNMCHYVRPWLTVSGGYSTKRKRKYRHVP